MTNIEDLKEEEIGNDTSEEEVLESGWAWFIVIGSFIVHVIVGGLMRSAGILFILFREKFHQSAAVTAWAVTMCTILRFFFGPLVSTLCNRFDCRRVVVLGGLIMSTGIFLTAFCPNLWWTFATNGLLSGIGQSFCYTSAVIIVGLYFRRRQSTAIGIANSGVGAGTFMAPPLVEFLFNDYGFQGVFFILSAFAFHACLAGILFRPIELHRKICRLQRKSNRSNFDSNKMDETRPKSLLSRKDMRLISTMSLTYDLDITGSLRLLEYLRTDENLHVPEKHILKPFGRHLLDQLPGTNSTRDTSTIGKPTPKLNDSVRSLPVKIADEEHAANSYLMPKLQSTGSSDVSEDLNDNDNDNNDDGKSEFKQKRKPWCKWFDPEPLKDLRFTALCLGICLLTLSFQSSYVFLPSLAIEKGLSQTQGSFLVSITGAMELLGSVTTGFILDIRFIRPHRLTIYAIVLFIMGVSILIMPYLTYFPLFACAAGVFGYLLGMCLAQKPTFVVEVTGLDKLVSAFGLLVWFQGLGTVIGPPLSGYIKDRFGRYEDGFLVGGAMLIGASLCQIVERCICFRRKEKNTEISTFYVR